MLLLGCDTSDIDTQLSTNNFGSSLESGSDFKRSTFSLSRSSANINETVESLTIELTSYSDTSVTYSFLATLTHDELIIDFCMLIASSITIQDDDYTILFRFDDNTIYLPGIVVSISDEMVYMLTAVDVTYDSQLSGEGSAESPYIIGSTDDFASFKSVLSLDATYASGLYFEQTADFRAPAVSDGYDGVRYAAAPFSGIYNGSGHTINMEYAGQNDSDYDSNIGLFELLDDGACVSNLNLTVSIKRAYDNVGALAGMTSGNVTIDGVLIDGDISDCNSNVGGFFGYVSGALTVKDCKLYSDVEGDTHIGGLAGYVDNATLIIDGFSNMESEDVSNMINVKANTTAAGGVAGTMIGGRCEISNVTLKNSISSNGTGITCIYSGNNEVGGLFGRLKITGESSFTDISIQSPVQSLTKDAGGLIGTAHFNNIMTFSNCTFASYITSGKYVGGLIGYLDGTGTLCLGTGSVLSHNYVMTVDEGYNAINGDNCVGGAIGKVSECGLEINSVCKINTIITGTTSVGGLIGVLQSSSLDCSNFVADSNMYVYGTEYVGGVIGELCSSQLYDTNSVTIFDDLTIPDVDSYTSTYNGFVRCLSDYKSGNCMGGIVGYSRGSGSAIKGCRFSGTVMGSSCIGGIVGKSDGYTTIEDCVTGAEGDLAGYTSGVGGIVGYIQNYNADIARCVNYQYINASSANYVGGVIGEVGAVSETTNHTLNYCMNRADVVGCDYVGGVLGYMYGKDDRSSSFTINYLVNYGDVTSKKSEATGGVIGYAKSDRIHIFYCVNHGDVSASGSVSNLGGVGGVVGILGLDAVGVQEKYNYELAYSCNRGSIKSSNEDSHCGGIVGHQEEGSGQDDDNWALHNCYNAGTVTSKQDTKNGGLTGSAHNHAKVWLSINLGRVSYGYGSVGDKRASFSDKHLYSLDGTSGSGTDKHSDTFSSSKKYTSSTFSSFDFSKIWAIDSQDRYNNGYPYLRYCLFQEPE